MNKLNPSVLKCLHPGCTALPNVQVDVQKKVRGDFKYTEAQGLACKEHTGWLMNYLKEEYPGFYITLPIYNPIWLTKAQRELQHSEEGQSTQLPAHEKTASSILPTEIVEDKKPQTREELLSLINSMNERNRRK